MDTSKIGKSYPPFEYEVGREKIREYANAVGETNAIYHDRDAARNAGFRDVVAPPMFAVVYSAGAMGPAILDPELGINLMLMLHGSQEFFWSEPVCAGRRGTTGVLSVLAAALVHVRVAASRASAAPTAHASTATVSSRRGPLMP